MSGNTFGSMFKVTTFGESHGAALGCVIDGCPAGIPISQESIQQAVNRRRAQTDNVASTSRTEADTVEILSGVYENKSTGTPIALLIRNTSQHSADYNNLENTFRPGHADFTYQAKYGVRDHRGGGRSSGRETVARVAAGAIATAFLETLHKNQKSEAPKIIAYTIEAAGIKCSPESCKKLDFSVIEKNPLRAIDLDAAELMVKKINELKQAGDSAGGIIECRIIGIKKGIGEPAFEKLDAQLAKAMLSIGAVKGIEFGAGFDIARMYGSQSNDAMRIGNDGKPEFLSNNAGGILGGISNGNEIIFRIAVKPVPSISIQQKTITKNNENIDIEIKGRHDVCLCPRIVPVVEAMSALTLADLYLCNSQNFC